MPTISGIHSDEDHIHEDRVHSEAPAEGDLAFEEIEIRVHSLDPAEGPDED